MDGKPASFSGFYRGGWDANYATLSAAWNADPRPSVYFSYIYDFVRANFARLPLWYEIGIAGYYSTFRTDGDEAHTGMVSEDDLRVLREALMWIPLERVFAIDRSSPEYLDRVRKRVYFAECWALIHYLSRGNESRTPQLSRFMALLGQGMPQDTAFREAFGGDYSVLFGELTSYVRNNRRYFYNRAKFTELKPPTEARVTPMTYEQILIRLGDLLASDDGRGADAERFYQAALSADPASAGALGGLGWLRHEHERKDEAASLLTRAADGGSTDYRVYYGVGRLRWDELASQLYDANVPTAAQRASLEAARAALRRSVELEPDFAEAWVELGRTYRLEPRGASVDAGIAALEEARKRLPSRDDVTRDLALLYRRKGDASRADALLQSVGDASGGGGVKGSTDPARTGGRQPFESEMLADFDVKVARINALIEAGQLDEAVAGVEALIAETGGETRAQLVAQRDDLRKAAAHNHAIADYNAAIALYNRGDKTGGIAALRKLAADCPDADLAAKARAQANAMAGKPPGKPESKK